MGTFILMSLSISVIELACGDYGKDKITTMVNATQNGRAIEWFTDAENLPPTTHVEGEAKRNAVIIIRLEISS